MTEKFQRPMLIAGVVLTGYLLLLQWQADYSNTPPPEAPAPTVEETPISDLPRPSRPSSGRDPR